MLRTAAVLFDLDGTLVSTAGAGRRSIDQALREMLELPQGIGDLRLDGMTDRAIVREAVRLGRSRACTESEIDRVLGRYLELLEVELLSSDVRVYPGVRELIAALAGERVLVGMGTGNVERGARLKLGRSGLNPLLPFGGFGSDAEDRSQLLAVGHRRASERAGRALLTNELWVVGDTPRDVQAGRAIGARVLAVATGRFSVAELAATRPDLAVENLADPAAWDALARWT